MRECEEQSFMEGSDDEYLPLDSSDRNIQQLDTSLNHSGLAKKTVCATDAAVQCEMGDVDAIERPKIHIGACNCTNAIKSTCVKVSGKCNISTECSWIAVKAVCKGLYHHTYLDRDEVIDSYPNLAKFRDIIPRAKKTHWWQMDDTCHNAGLPTIWKCVTTGKDHQWAQTKPSSAKWDLQPGVKVTLHYDSMIDGD